MKKLLFALLAGGCLPLAAQNPKTTQAEQVRVSGFAITQYQYSAQDGNKANSFSLRMARLAIDGRVAGDFYWKAQMQVTGNTSTLATSPRLVDAFVEWQRHKECQVRIGEYQVPFTLESPIHPIDVGFMDNAQAVLKLVGYADRSGAHSSNGRDIGLMLQGDLLPTASGRRLLHYAVSVVNGQGINLKDIDQRKNIVGCLWLMPVNGMRIGVSGWEGSYARKGHWTDPATGAGRQGVRSLPQHRYAISADYTNDGLTLRSEYIHSTGNAFAHSMLNTDDADATDCTLASSGSKADGFYAMAIVPVVSHKINVKARYDTYRNNAKWNSAKTYYEIGGDYLWGKSLKLSAEYALVNDRTLAKQNYNMLTAELAVRF